MPLLYDIPDETKSLWDSIRESLRGPVESVDKATKWPFPDSVAGPGLLSAFDAVYPKDPKEAFVGGILGLAPGYIAANYRSPEQIQALRKMMAEEMRSRGPVGQVVDRSKVPFSPKDITAQFTDAELPEWLKSLNSAGFEPYSSELGHTKTNPIDQILRGSWYHGMSSKARTKTIPESWLEDYTWAKGGKFDPEILSRSGVTLEQLEDKALRGGLKGLPISLHDTASISNKLGEPAGVSISMLPTKAKEFSADEYIHRVLPQYGGPPTERVVNLMSPEGRTALNDAYDVVANKMLSGNEGIIRLKSNYDPEMLDILKGEPQMQFDQLMATVQDAIGHSRPGPFNQQLSNQLQSSGYRGLLYNPQRWNEHEMLMLDPKYVLPLDYRPVDKYTAPVSQERHYGLPYPGSTPGTAKGLSQIEDLMAQNKSWRLGDIYSERPWTQRLSEENKQRLLELIDPQYREVVGNQLYQP